METPAETPGAQRKPDTSLRSAAEEQEEAAWQEEEAASHRGDRRHRQRARLPRHTQEPQ